MTEHQLDMFGGATAGQPGAKATPDRRAASRRARDTRAPADPPDLFGGQVRPPRRRRRFTVDQLAERLGGIASTLPLGVPHTVLAVLVLGVTLAEHSVANATYEAIADSANPATTAAEILDGGVALTPQLWRHIDVLADALRSNVGDADRERTVGRLAETLAEADLDTTFGVDPDGHHDRLGPDLLGELYSRLRSNSAKKDRGAFYTPANLTLMMGEMALPREGDNVADLAVGSGIMFWGAASAMRRAELDPRTCTWFGIDIDPVAIAITAVNAIPWRLHDRVVLYVGNGLTTDIHTMVEAEQERLRAGRERYLPVFEQVIAAAGERVAAAGSSPAEVDDLSA